MGGADSKGQVGHALGQKNTGWRCCAQVEDRASCLLPSEPGVGNPKLPGKLQKEGNSSKALKT